MVLEEIVKINVRESLNPGMKVRLDRSDTLGWLKTIAGFANAGGGDMFIGVEDRTRRFSATAPLRPVRPARQHHTSV